MDIIKWDNSFSVNVKLIDNEHKKLINLTNNFHNALEKNENILRSLFNDLLEYIIIHFSKEETFFDEFKYDRSLTHKREHETLENKTYEIFYKFYNENSIQHTEISKFLAYWITNHIKISDKQYSKCFNINGLT